MHTLLLSALKGGSKSEFLSPHVDRHAGDISFIVCLFVCLFFVFFVCRILVTDISVIVSPAVYRRFLEIAELARSLP